MKSQKNQIKLVNEHNKCVKCGRRLRVVKQYNEDKHKLIDSVEFVECERCKVLYRISEGFNGVNW